VGPLGHSDGDAVIHALIDAMLGAAAKGDIGRLFPDTEAEWAGVDSRVLLTKTVRLVDEAGWRLVNADVTVITERPFLAPRITEMAQVLSEVLGAADDVVSIKATRGEGLGPEGRGDCVTVQAVVLLGATGESGGDELR